METAVHIRQCGAEAGNMFVWSLNFHIHRRCLSELLISRGDCVAVLSMHSVEVRFIERLEVSPPRMNIS
jgi:hypothetical protein